VFLLDASGNLLISNQDGQQLLQQDAALAEALRRGQVDPKRFLVRPLAEFPGHALLIQKLAQAPSARVDSAARRWNLTRRQTEVLHQLLEGQGNRSIARRLGCAEKTVEVHVSKILARSGLSNRAAVISHLLQEG